MFFFESNHEVERLLREILETERSISRSLHRIELLLTPKRTRYIQLRFGGNIMAIPGTIVIGGTLTGTVIPLEVDGVTVIPGAVVSGQSYSVDNPAIVTLVTNPDGTATFTGVDAGSATVSVTATVTDADGVQGTFATANSITVTAPTQRTASIELRFS